MSSEAGPSRLPRTPCVSQLDADELDEGLVSMLGERVERALSNFKGLSTDLKPEINLALKLVIFRFAIFASSHPSSPGAKLQNLKLASTRTSSTRPHPRTLLLYLLLHPPLFPAYLLTRLRQHALSAQWPDLPAHDWRRKAWRAIGRLEDAARVWELAGWGWFLWDGMYPSLLMRILRLRLVPSSPHLARLVSYEFMNRQLVWSAFTEFLMFSIPLLPTLPSSLRPPPLLASLRSFLLQPTSIDYTALPLLPPPSPTLSSSKPSHLAHAGPLAHLPGQTCPICHLRTSAAPQPISADGAGHNISLPRLDVAQQLDDDGGAEDEGDEETRVFVPAKGDCWGGCEYCYYCIGQELARFEAEMEERRKRGLAQGHRQKKERGGSAKYGEGAEADSEQDKWSCLRCGGGVSRAWRVGAELHQAGA